MAWIWSGGDYQTLEEVERMLLTDYDLEIRARLTRSHHLEPGQGCGGSASGVMAGMAILPRRRA